MLTHIMARHLAESGADLNSDAECALALLRAMIGTRQPDRRFSSDCIAKFLSGAMEQAREIRPNPEHQPRPVVSYRGERGRFVGRAA